MFPGYGYMDSYPKPYFYQNSHIPFHHPSWEAKPEQAPTTYGPWSYSGSFGYPSPMQCHGCCSQVYHPGYYSARPPHSHLPPPSPLYHHGPYSPCEAYPPYSYHYRVPPHHFMEQPRYEYDKDMNGRHCCGCHNQKGDKGVKIEEHEPESKRESLAPVKLETNYPFPFVWIPPEHLKDKSVNQAREEKENERRKDEDKRPQFPFPVYWLPSHGKSGDSENKDHKDSYTNEQPMKLKIIPVSFSGKDDHRGKSDVMEDANGDRVLVKKAEKDVETKTIPTKPVGENRRSKEENENKSSDDNLKNQSSSPKKGSKLPPVCLRVDPLPRRRSGNGTSRSPSPPGVKLNTNQSFDGTKSTSMPVKESSGPAEQVSLQNNVEEQQPNVDGKKNVDCREEEESLSCDQGVRRASMELGREKKDAKKELSVAEAVVHIQSFYRGFEVRKWEPLKKLKQIAKVCEQANKVRDRIEMLKSSELQKSEKEKVLIGETIMSLLLQLDTIQGLHPTVREIRKSVARELVSLQERLDSLVCQTAREEETPEVAIASETSLQETSHEDIVGSGFMPPDSSAIAKETDKLSVEEVKQATELPIEINTSDESQPEAKESAKEENFEVMEGAKEENEASESGSAVSTEILPVEDNKGEETEMENCTKQNSTVVGGMESSDMECDERHSPEQLQQEMPHEMSPTIDDKQVLFPGKENSLLEMVVVNKKTPSETMSAELAAGEENSVLQDKGLDSTREDVLASQVEEEKHDEAEYMTQMVSEELHWESDAVVVMGGEEFVVQDKATSSIAEDTVASEMVDNMAEIVNGNHPLEDLDNITEVVNEKPIFDSDTVVEEHNETVNEAESLAVEEKHNEDASGASHTEQVLVSTEILDNESTDETPENEVHFHDKDVIPSYPNAEMVLGNEELILQNKPANLTAGDPVASEMVDNMLEVVNEKSLFSSENVAPMLAKEDLQACAMEIADGEHSDAAHMTMNEVTFLNVEEQRGEDAVEAPWAEQPSTEEAASEATEILDNEPTSAETPESEVHFHDKDVISESASLTKEPKAPSVTAETQEAEQEVPVKGEVNFNSKEKAAAYDKGLMEENEKLRVLLGKLLQEGKQQLNVISNLNGRVKDLERKLTKKKKLRMRRQRAPKLDKCAV